MFFEIVSETPRSVCGLAIAPAKDLVVGSYMVDRLSLCDYLLDHCTIPRYH
jgi:hypothetical protein